jgi:hypothetical protein
VLAQEVTPKQPIEQPAAQKEAAKERAVKPDLDPLVTPTKPAAAEHDRGPAKEGEGGADDRLFWGDGIAQWTMALTGVFALFLSTWAVWLLKRTVDETRKAVKAADDAVNVTRELGEAQIRAYLSCKSGKYKLTKDRVSAVVEIENTGQSPASDVLIAGTTSLYYVGGMRLMPRVLSWLNSSNSTFNCPPINSRGRIVEEIVFFFDDDFLTETNSDDAEMRRYTFDNANELSFDLTIKWADVFTKRREAPVTLYGVIAASPSNPRKKRTGAGVLHPRMEDARHSVSDEGGD